MLLGIPAVASDIPGVDEIIVHGRTGYLAASRNASAFAQHIARLLDDDVLRGRMGAEAKCIASTSYSIERMLEEHLKHYEAASRSRSLSKVP